MLRVGGASLAVFLLIMPCNAVAFDGEPGHPRHVLILYSHRYALPVNLQWDRGIRTGIEENLREPVAIDVEYLDFERLKQDEYRDSWVALLRQKYADCSPDVVMPVNDAAAVCMAERYPGFVPAGRGRVLFGQRAGAFAFAPDFQNDRRGLSARLPRHVGDGLPSISRNTGRDRRQWLWRR